MVIVTHLEARLHVVTQPVDHARRLDEVHGASSKPRAGEFREERLFDDEGADAGGEAEQLVEAQGHGVDRAVGEVYDRRRSERGRIEEHAVPQRLGVLYEAETILAFGHV